MLRHVVGVVVLAFAAVASAGSFTLEKLDDRVVVRDGKEVFTEYRFEERRPCLFPVFGPAGRHMTRRWPLGPSADHPESEDHPHHSGIWYAHGDVRLIGTDLKADFWHDDRIEHLRFVDFGKHAQQDTLVVESAWKHESGTTLCSDQTRITFGKSDGNRWIDFEITIKAPPKRDLLLGDTKEGTMAIRVPETMTLQANNKKLRHLSKGHITNSKGVTGREAWGKSAKWCAFYGPVEGDPALIAIFDHPQNPRYPTWWMARHYGLFAANAFGKSFFTKAPKGSGDFTIPAGKTATFRYRFLFQAAEFDAEKIEARFNDYAGSPKGQP